MALCILFASLKVEAQEPIEIPVKSKVSEVTVFLNGAQVLRKKQVPIPAGKSLLKFVDLSPYADAKSVQPKVVGSAMVMSVNYIANSPMKQLEKLSEDKEAELRKKYDEVSNQLLIEVSNREVIRAELDFLEGNKKIGGANNGVTLTTLRETANYYRERLTLLKRQDIAVNKKIEELGIKKNMLSNEINLQGNTRNTELSPMGEVQIEIEAKVATTVAIDLSYYVHNASWYPSYDIRAISIEKPIDLLYKANIQQNTKEDWDNVKLKISSSDPNLGNVVPQLKTYILDYAIAPPRYSGDASSNHITGIIYDENNDPVIGATIKIPGTTIGTVADIDGRFSITLPSNSSDLRFNYIGYIEKQIKATPSMIVYLEPDNHTLDDIVVVSGYSSKSKKNITGASATLKELNGRVDGVSVRQDIALPTEVITNQTAVEFEIKVPYTVKSNKKSTTVEIDRYSLPADYEYYAIPKINKDAFLLANIADWEKYNLLAGEANIFFEDTYVGKTILDTRYVIDTLNISLGRDKSILVNRESVRENTSKKAFSSNKEEVREWKISIRNNKSQEINFTLLDQVPVSRRDEISVKTENLSGGTLNEQNGEVKWKLLLKPSGKQDVNLKYRVKYPNSKKLMIE